MARRPNPEKDKILSAADLTFFRDRLARLSEAGVRQAYEEALPGLPDDRPALPRAVLDPTARHGVEAVEEMAEVKKPTEGDMLPDNHGVNKRD